MVTSMRDFNRAIVFPSKLYLRFYTGEKMM